MLFVALLKAAGGTPKENIARRAQWQYPEGTQPVAEYWLQTGDPLVISIFEADSVAPIMAVTTEWGDIFDVTIVSGDKPRLSRLRREPSAERCGGLFVPLAPRALAAPGHTPGHMVVSVSSADGQSGISRPAHRQRPTPDDGG